MLTRGQSTIGSGQDRIDSLLIRDRAAERERYPSNDGEWRETIAAIDRYTGQQDRSPFRVNTNICCRCGESQRANCRPLLFAGAGIAARHCRG